jgi:hypothetical protein
LWRKDRRIPQSRWAWWRRFLQTALIVDLRLELRDPFLDISSTLIPCRRCREVLLVEVECLFVVFQLPVGLAKVIQEQRAGTCLVSGLELIGGMSRPLLNLSGRSDSFLRDALPPFNHLVSTKSVDELGHVLVAGDAAELR